MKTATVLSLACIATLLATARTRADVPPPETEPCAGKAAGAECTYVRPGVCQEGTCSRLDYSKWDRDASSSPPTTTYPCLKCVTGTTTNTDTATATNTDTKSPTATDTNTDTKSPTATNTSTATATPTASQTDTATASPTATATNTATATPSANGTSSQTGTDTSSSSDSGWCSVGKGSAASRWVPWLMAAAFSLLFLVGRRRK